MDTRSYPRSKAGLRLIDDGSTARFFDGVTGETVYTVDLATGKITFEQTITVPNMQMNLVTPAIHGEGIVHWNADDGTLEVGMPGGNVNLQIGQELVVKVKAGEDITNGQPLYVSGASNDRPIVNLAQADGVPQAYATLVATEDIANNQAGYATTFGMVRDIDTKTVPLTEGAIFYLDAATPGAFTMTPPTAPNFKIFMGICLKQSTTEGVIIVRPVTIPRMAILSDVYLSGAPADGQYLAWSAANGRFELAGP